MNFVSSCRVTSVALLACALVSSATAASKIGVLLKGRSAFWLAVERGALDAGQAAGVEVTVKMPPTEADIAVQVQLLNGLIAQGIDALVIAPSSKEALSEPVAAAFAKGLKVVVLDSQLNGDFPVFVSTNHADAGTAAGRLLATLVTDDDEVSFLKHTQISGATTVREVAAFNALREAHPKLVVHRDIFSSAELGAESQKAHILLAQHPKTKAILASGTPGTMAMLHTLQEMKLAGTIKLVGFGFNLNPEVAAALESGALHGWIAQLPHDIGQKGLASAVSLLKGETLPARVSCDFLVVTKDNLHDPAVQALLPKS